MEPMTIALIVLVVAAVWAVVELALTLRRTRKDVGELAESVNDAIGELRPAISKLDAAADELVPASKRIEPILEKAATSVDLVNVDLVRIESILSDVGTVTDTGARASDAVTGAVDAVASGVAGVVGKVTGKGAGKASSRLSGAKAAEAATLEAPKEASGADEPPVERVSGDAGYFTYPTAGGTTAGEGAGAASPAPEAATATDE